MTTKNVSVRLAAVGGKQVKAELSEIGQEGARSFQQLERSAVGSGAGLQNVGYQVQDFAVQVAGGTDATRALAQQLPQLLSGFGLWGVALGTATAVLVPLVSSLMSADEEAQDLDKTLRNMEGSVRDLKAITEQYTLTGIVELTEKYGELNAEVLKLIERKDQMDLSNALGQAKDAIAGVKAEFGDGLFSTKLGEEADFLGIQMQIPMLNEFGDAIIGINPQLAEFEALMQAVADAETLDGQAAATARLLDFLEGTAAEGGNLWDSLVQLQDQLTQMAAAGAENAGWLTSMVASAGDLASTMWDAAGAAWSFSQAATKRAAAEASLDTFKTAGAYQLYADTRNAAPDVPVAAPKARKGRSAGGGGRVSDDERAAERIFKSTRTEAEKYAAELEKIEDLHGKNLISDDTYARALDNLSDSTNKAADAAKGMENSFGEAFTSFITGAKSAQEAVGDLLSSLAETLANSAFQSLSEGLFGKDKGGFGGWLSGLISGGGKAGGGRVRAGMSYMVGEAGTERFTPLTDGYITPNAALRSGQSTGSVINIDARGAQAGVAEQIAKALEAAAPVLIKRSVAASRGAASRGY